MEMLTGPESAKYNRKPEIMADAAYAILTSDPKTTTGNFFIDEQVLRDRGVTDFDQYCIDPAYKDQLMPDGFVDENISEMENRSSDRPSLATPKIQGDGRIVNVFKAIEQNLSAEAVQKTQAVFQFVVTGEETGKWWGSFFCMHFFKGCFQVCRFEEREGRLWAGRRPFTPRRYTDYGY